MFVTCEACGKVVVYNLKKLGAIPTDPTEKILSPREIADKVDDELKEQQDGRTQEES